MCVLLLFLSLLAASAALAAPAVTTQEMPDPIPAENGMLVVSIPVQNMPIETAVQQARLFASPGGVVMGDDRLHRLVVKDRPENIEKMKAHLQHADVALPMVRMAVSFDTTAADRQSEVGVGAVVVDNRVYASGTASSHRGGASGQATMSVLTMSGSEGVIRVGENIAFPLIGFFHDHALRRGYLARGVVFQSVSTGFGVVPIVVGNDEIRLRIYPWVSYQSPSGPGVIRYMDAATEIRARNGQSVEVAASSSDTGGVFGRILSTGSYSSSHSGRFVITPSIARDPYAR